MQSYISRRCASYVVKGAKIDKHDVHLVTLLTDRTVRRHNGEPSVACAVYR